MIADFLFATEMIERLRADARKRESKIIDALRSGAEVEPGRHSASITNNRLAAV
jgi:hypothetical protein